MKIKPLGEYVVTIPVEKEERITAGGIVVQASADEKGECVAIIVECSSKVKKNMGNLLKAGAKVIYKPHYGIPLRNFLILREEDLVGVIQEDD